MAVNQLHPPSANCCVARRRLNKPARGSRVMSRLFPGRSHQQPHPATALGRQLQPPGFDTRQPRRSRHHRPDPPAPQALGHGPYLIRPVSRPQKHQPIEPNSRLHQRRRINLPIRVAPGDHPPVDRSRLRQQTGHKPRLTGPRLVQHLMNHAVRQRRLRQQLSQSPRRPGKRAVPAGRHLCSSQLLTNIR